MEACTKKLSRKIPLKSGPSLAKIWQLLFRSVWIRCLLYKISPVQGLLKALKSHSKAFRGLPKALKKPLNDFSRAAGRFPGMSCTLPESSLANLHRKAA